MPTLFFDTGINATGFRRDLAGMQSMARSFAGSMTSILGTAAAAFAGLAAGAAVGAQFVQAGAQMETFETRLSTLMGSSDAARERLTELYDFAAQTPFELDQVVAAEVTLRGFGAAADEVMPGLIDFAATTGAELSQSAIDIGKAWNQGATGLESDTAKILRKQIELRSGVDATTMSIEEFRAALLDTLGTGMFEGGAARLSRTFSGMVSNLQDSWSGFKRDVADAGLFDVVKDALGDTLDLLGKNKDATKEWAGIVSDSLVLAFRGAAYAVAVVYDVGTGLKMVLVSATASAASLGSTLLTATEAARQTTILMADALGIDTAVTAMLKADTALGNIRAGLDATRDSSLKWLTDLGQSTTALETVRAMFADVATSSETVASNMSGGATGAAAPTGAGPTDDEYARAVEAAAQFAAEVFAINADAFDRERQERERLYQEAQVYYDLGITDLATFTAEKEAIRLASEERMFALDLEVARREAAAHEETMRRIEEEERARRAMLVSGLSTASSVFGSIASVVSTYLEDSKAAQKRWGLWSIAIDTAIGIAKAYAQFGWPGGTLPAAEVTAIGATQAAIVAKQHQGGVVMGNPFPDEYDQGGVRRLRQEMTVTLPTHLTRAVDGLSAALSGGGGGAVELRIGREMQYEILRETTRTGAFGQAVQRVSTPSPGTSRALAVA